jgi:endogenous inhibitor of DNA gyrase (YacG/DUF329 family)
MPIVMQLECVVCGKVIDEEVSVLWQSNEDGYDFCSSECRRIFEQQRGIAPGNNPGE